MSSEPLRTTGSGAPTGEFADSERGLMIAVLLMVLGGAAAMLIMMS